MWNYAQTTRLAWRVRKWFAKTAVRILVTFLMMGRQRKVESDIVSTRCVWSWRKKRPRKNKYYKTMNIKYDVLADALYIKLKNGKVAETREEGPYLVDYDEQAEVLGI